MQSEGDFLYSVIFILIRDTLRKRLVLYILTVLDCINVLCGTVVIPLSGLKGLCHQVVMSTDSYFKSKLARKGLEETTPYFWGKINSFVNLILKQTRFHFYVSVSRALNERKPIFCGLLHLQIKLCARTSFSPNKTDT